MRRSQLVSLIILSLVLGLLPFATVAAADGDNLRTIIADRTGTDCASVNAEGDHSSVGVGIAFDGSNLLISCYSDNTVVAISPADGSQVGINAITGASYLGALAWDDDRGLLWACSNFSDVGTIDLATDVFTYAFTTQGCFDGLAYDGSDDTLWASGDVATHVEHYTTTGTELSSSPVTLGGIGNSGIAVGGPNLYLANNGGSQIYTVPKDFSSETLFATFSARLEDLECDNLTFAGVGKAAIWSIDAYDNILNAWEIPAGACEFGGGDPGGPNTPPTADAGGPYTGDEGAAVAISGTASDTDGDTLTTTWSYAPVSGVDAGAACSFADAIALATTVTCTDDGAYSLTLTVDDGNGGTTTSTTSLTLANVAPSGTITSPADASVVAINTLVTLTSAFSDPGTNDSHTCDADWGSGSGFESGSGGLACTDTHTYALPGIYTVTARVTDDDGGVGSDSIMLVVYDPAGGFVTGGGWIDSPAGAYTADPDLSGKATFGFVSKYKKGASLPDGNTEFQFQAASFNFHSTGYDWLVVNKASKNAQFKGTGTVNGSLDPNGDPYRFMLWATDGTPDLFRIQIWSEDPTVGIVYDNGAAQPIGSGSIVVHVK